MSGKRVTEVVRSRTDAIELPREELIPGQPLGLAAATGDEGSPGLQRAALTPPWVPVSIVYDTLIQQPRSDHL